MPVDRYFLESGFSLGEQCLIAGGEYHHLAHVVRAKEGDRLELINGRGYLAQARIIKLSRRDALCELEAVDYFKPPSFCLILAQAMPRAKRLDTILEKVTELGVNEIHLFPGERSETAKRSENLERMRLVLIAAMKQSGRLYLPKLVMKPKIASWQAFSGRGFFGDIHPSAPLFGSVWRERECLARVMFVIGPESGLTKFEESFLKGQGYEGVKLSDAILRTDTASIVALSLMSHYFLDKI